MATLIAGDLGVASPASAPRQLARRYLSMNTSSPCQKGNDAVSANGPAKLSLPGAGKGRLGAAGKTAKSSIRCDLGAIFHVARTVFGADDAAGKGREASRAAKAGEKRISSANYRVEVSANWQR